jgi:hypothetical protein
MGRGSLVTDIQQRIANLLREHRFWSLAQGDCECGWEDTENPDVLAHVASVLVEQLGLTQEWSNAYEQQGDGGAWHETRTAALPREITEANMRLREAEPSRWIRNMRIESRWVTGWERADD